MSKAPSMPMFWDAYLADTTHLTTEEHGAYLLLLAAMWRRDGSVPDDDKDNARIIGLSKAKWCKIKTRLSSFLIFENDTISQKNLQKIWKKTQEKIQKNSENGRKGGRPVSNENNDLAKANGSGSVNPNVTIPEPEPEPEKEEEEEPPKPPTGAGSDFLKEMENQTSAVDVFDRCLEITSLKEKKPGDARKWIRIVRGWMDSGAIPDKHIYPVIKRMKSETKINILSLGFFTEKILAEINKIPQFEKDRIMWRRRVERFKQNQFWPQSYGMEPGHIECMAPPEVLEEFGFKAFRMVTPAC